MCDKIIEETKTIPTNFNEKLTCKTKKNYIIYLLFINYYSTTVSC